MTRSVEELRRESERSRAQLAATVDRLREQITDTAEDLRYKVSPQGIKAEVSDFVSRKTQGWLETLKQQASEHPMQTLAAGTALAVPALRLVRGFPLPLLMIGAGLVLTSKTVRDRGAEATAPVIDRTKEMASGVAERIQSLGGDTSDAVSATGRRAADLASEAQARAVGVAGNLKDRMVETTDNVKAGIDAASRTVRGTTERVRDGAAAAPEAARKMIGDNAGVIAGLGVAIGAIIAASLPDTKAETSAIGKASEGVKRAAGKAAQSSFETAKDAVLSAADAAARSVSTADLGKHGSRMTQAMSEKLSEAADDILSAAFDPPRTEEKPS